MLKKNIRTICASLVATGAIFFVGSAYSVGSSVVVGQPQLDTPAAVNTTVATANAPQNANTSSATKEAPAANGQAVEREIFKGEVATNK